VVNKKNIKTPELWQRAKNLSIERGEFVRSVISHNKNCINQVVLDVGCGVGGTSSIFSKDNFVISIDKNITKIIESDVVHSLHIVQSDARRLPLKKGSIDIIIFQDVIEHLEDRSEIAQTFFDLLKKSGSIFLSTPNKFSVFNFLSDPHWGLPVVSLLQRKTLRKYVLPIFRKEDKDRKDIAQLYSLNDLIKIFQTNFEIKIFTSFAVCYLFQNGKGILWSNFHLFLLKICKLFKLNLIVGKIANDKFGFLNKFITPTFYFVLTKKNLSTQVK